MTPDILLVDDDPATIKFMSRLLSGTGHHRFATSGQSALRLAHERRPDLMLLDADMPEMSGFQVCQHMQSDPELSQVPVIFVSSHAERDFELAGLGMGAEDYIAKPLDEARLRARVDVRLRSLGALDRLRLLATVDELTLLDNRRAFDALLVKEWRRTLREGQSLSMLLVEIDHFDRFAAAAGTAARNACLQSVAQALQAVIYRPADAVARYHGPCFALLLPQTPRLGAGLVAQRVHQAVAGLQILNPVSPSARHISVSVGLTSYDNESEFFKVEPSAGDPLRSSARSYTPVELRLAAGAALRAAQRAGGAQGWMLDLCDFERPVQAMPVDAALSSPFAGG